MIKQVKRWLRRSKLKKICRIGYFRELYSKQNPVDETILWELSTTNATDHMEDFMKEEVEKCLKKGKAPGVDSITAGSVEVLHFLLQNNISIRELSGWLG